MQITYIQKLFYQNNHEEAISYYIKTVKYLNPSVVILKYLDMQNL